MPSISIIIPCKNAGPEFEKTLQAVFSQTNVPPFEVIVIDSGSTDGTLELCTKYEINLCEIPPTEYGHSKTRNFGASMAKGDFLVFMVQDAIPVGKHWLENLIRPLKDDNKIAGVYSRNIPRADASKRQTFEMQRYFDLQKKLQTSSADHIFSNVSSAIRSTVFQKFPFPSTEFGEDQLWAKLVLESGYYIVYEPSSAVIHSHSDGLKKSFARGYHEGCFAKTIGNALWHSSHVTIFLEAIYETVKWALRGDVKSCWYSIVMAAWHCGFLKGFAAKR